MLTAKDIMTTKVITVNPDMPVEGLATILWNSKISGAPVVDAEGTVIGIVTENDLIDQTKRIHIPTMISFLDSVIMLESGAKVEKELSKMTGTTVGDICSKKVISINEDAPLDEIASIMSEKGVHTIPVFRGKELVGIVGKNDIIKTLAKKAD